MQEAGLETSQPPLSNQDISAKEVETIILWISALSENEKVVVVCLRPEPGVPAERGEHGGGGQVQGQAHRRPHERVRHPAASCPQAVIVGVLQDTIQGMT